MGPPKIFDFWGELKPKSPQLLRSSGSCDLSARMGGIMGPPKIFDFWGELKRECAILTDCALFIYEQKHSMNS